MQWKKVSYPFGPVTMAAGTKKLVVGVKTPSGQIARIASFRAGILGAASTDPQALFEWGILSGATAGGTSITGQKVDQTVLSSVGSTGADCSGGAFTGTVPTVSVVLERTPLYPNYTLNPEKAAEVWLDADQSFGLAVTPASGGAATPTVAGTIDMLELV